MTEPASTDPTTDSTGASEANPHAGGETSAELRFDKAAYAPAPEGAATSTAPRVPCGNCKKPLGEEYWTWHAQVMCARCRDLLAATVASSQTASSFGKAALQGGGVALVCGIAYAVFVGVTNIQIAFATIGIAVVIAKVVRKASRGVSGRRFQVLAVALTYLASAMGYAPGIYKALTSAPTHHAAGAATESAAADSAPDLAVTPASALPPAKASNDATNASTKSAGPLQVLIAVGFLVGLTLAAPFLELTEAPIGFVIIAIGLWQAWKLSRGVPTKIEGPFRSAAQTTASPAE